MTASDTTTFRLLGAAAALTVCTLAWPQVADAGISHDGLWGAPDHSCTDIRDWESDDLQALGSFGSRADADSGEKPVSRPTRDASSESGTSPCGAEADGSPAALNRCSAQVGAPASAVPDLVGRPGAGDPLGPGPSGLALSDEAPHSVPLADVPTPPDRSDSGAMCSSRKPENCRSLPPVPPQLNVEAPAVPPNLRASDLETPDRPDRDEPNARGGPDLELSDGYDSPPDKPPRRRLRSG